MADPGEQVSQTEPQGLVDCPACSEENSRSARFCQRCGTQLPEYQEPEVHTEPPSRAVTVAVVRLRSHDERSQRSTRHVLARIRGVFERHGGVARMDDDGVSAVFGSTTAHGTARCGPREPPRRHATCSRICRRSSFGAASLRSRSPPALRSNRSAVTSRRRRRTPLGMLADLAGDGDVLMSSEAHRLAGPASVEAEPLRTSDRTDAGDVRTDEEPRIPTPPSRPCRRTRGPPSPIRIPSIPSRRWRTRWRTTTRDDDGTEGSERAEPAHAISAADEAVRKKSRTRRCACCPSCPPSPARRRRCTRRSWVATPNGWRCGNSSSARSASVCASRSSSSAVRVSARRDWPKRSSRGVRSHTTRRRSGSVAETPRRAEPHGRWQTWWSRPSARCPATRTTRFARRSSARSRQSPMPHPSSSASATSLPSRVDERSPRKRRGRSGACSSRLRASVRSSCTSTTATVPIRRSLVSCARLQPGSPGRSSCSRAGARIRCTEPPARKA